MDDRLIVRSLEFQWKVAARLNLSSFNQKTTVDSSTNETQLVHRS